MQKLGFITILLSLFLVSHLSADENFSISKNMQNFADQKFIELQKDRIKLVTVENSIAGLKKSRKFGSIEENFTNMQNKILALNSELSFMKAANKKSLSFTFGDISKKIKYWKANHKQYFYGSIFAFAVLTMLYISLRIYLRRKISGTQDYSNLSTYDYPTVMQKYLKEFQELRSEYDSRYIEAVSANEKFSTHLSKLEESFREIKAAFDDTKTIINESKNEFAQNNVSFETLNKIKNDMEKLKAETVDNIHAFEKVFYEKINNFEAQPANSPENSAYYDKSIDYLGKSSEEMIEKFESYSILFDDVADKLSFLSGKEQNNTSKISSLESFFNTMNYEINSVVNELIDNNVSLTKKITEIHQKISKPSSKKVA